MVVWIPNHLNTELVKVRNSNGSVIWMFAIQIPTVLAFLKVLTYLKEPKQENFFQRLSTPATCPCTTTFRASCFSFARTSCGTGIQKLPISSWRMLKTIPQTRPWLSIPRTSCGGTGRWKKGLSILLLRYSHFFFILKTYIHKTNTRLVWYSNVKI